MFCMKHKNSNRKLGLFLKHQRLEKGFTRKQLVEFGAEFGICSENQLARIENGKCSPSTGTLQTILNALDTRMEDFFHKMNSQNIQMFNNHFNVMWDIVHEKGYNVFEEHLSELKCKEYCDTSEPVIEQAILLCEGIICKNILKNPHKSYEILLEALQLTASKNIVRYETIDYKFVATNSFSLNEYRILTVMANSKNKIGSYEEATKGLEAICFSLERKDTGYDVKKKLLPLTYYNLSVLLIKTHKNIEASKIADKGIAFCLNTKEFKQLGSLYVNKAHALYHINSIKNTTEYLHYFQLAYDTFVTQGNHAKAELVRNELVKNHDICEL